MRHALVLALAVCLGACASPPSSPTGLTDASATPPATSPDTITMSPLASTRASATAVPSQPSLAAGRPYSADDVLAAMRESRRPGGVPDQLETEQIAVAIAVELWTWSGEPWTSLTIGGSCGAERCSLDVSGMAPGGAGEDLYQLEIAGGSVTVAASQLRGYPPALDTELDALARDELGERLSGLVLQGARWLPPPNLGRFVLAYRSGGEERSPALDVTVDIETEEVIDAGPQRIYQ